MVFTLTLSSEELASLIEALEGNIACLTMLVRLSYQERQLQDKVEALALQQSLLARLKTLRKTDESY